jgi:hypothetical protein
MTMASAIATVSSAADDPQDCHWWDGDRYECDSKSTYIVETPDTAEAGEAGKRWFVCDKHVHTALFEARTYLFTGR